MESDLARPISPKVHSDGYWLSHEEGHCFDPVLAQQLVALFHGKNVCDFGCGLGTYVNRLRQAGIKCDGFDGNPNTEALSSGACHSLNLAKPFQLENRYDAILCLEVAEHIPKRYETTLLDNLTNHSKETIVLSWAVPGQDGDHHVNCRTNCYSIYQLWKRGFWLQPTATLSLRSHCSLPWFRNSLTVFSKRPVPLSMTELKATAKLVIKDIGRLNRSNSSLIAASIGKLFRIGALLQKKAVDAVGLARLLRYDATNFIRRKSPNKLSTQSQTPRRFIPICFTCAKHFDFVRLALLSLNVSTPLIREINIYVDKSDPFTEAQCKLLRSESRYPLKFELTKYPMAWAGVGVLLNELYAFRNLENGMRLGEVLMKFDSDVLFLSDAIFKLVATNDVGVVGTNIHQIQDIQGGCYFIAANELKAIVDRPITSIAMSVAKKVGGLPEDRFISNLLRESGVKIFFDDFLYFDGAFSNPQLDRNMLESRVRTIPSNASVLHFEGSKFNMRRVAERLFPTLPHE